MITQSDLKIANLGPRTVPSPLGLSTLRRDDVADYVRDEARVLLDVEGTEGEASPPRRMLERAGPRESIFFRPEVTEVGIVTCGGLCPGINNVVRSLVLELAHKYGVKRICGYRYGFEGIDPSSGLDPVPLAPADVLHVHRRGGSFLGCSRGQRDIGVLVEALRMQEIDILFVIGGDGTLRGAHAIVEEASRRGARLAVVAIPKTIDNDIAFVDKSFGYETAVEIARHAADCAHAEATGANNGVAVLKLMGRDSGWIAAAATIASREVNVCLVPEVRFELRGEHGLLAHLERRLAERRHAVVVVAEGCGSAIATASTERDASGNIRYASAEADIGPRLCHIIKEHFAERGLPLSLRYIDPSYLIRSVPANAHDAVLCDALARNAAHAAMAGKTDLVVGRVHGIFTHVPLAVATSERSRLDPDGPVWLAVTEATGQPRFV